MDQRSNSTTNREINGKNYPQSDSNFPILAYRLAVIALA